MNDKIEKNLKELLPYIIVIGVIFLLLPLLMGRKTSAVTYIVQLGVFPLTAIGCGAFYKYKNRRNSLALCVIAPVFYMLAALLYRMWVASWYTVIIYTVAYFLCGYVGMMLGEVLLSRKKDGSSRRRSLRPHRVNVEKEEALPKDFQAEDPLQDQQLNAATTKEDIESILTNIHNRK